MLLQRPGVDSAQDIAEKFKIRELIEFERFCRDCALWDEMKKCFAPDSTVNISWFRGSGHEFVEASSMMRQSATHKIYDTLVWKNGDKAVAITMASIDMRFAVQGSNVSIISDARLVYRLRKRDGLWYIVAFECVYEKDSIVPVYPSGNLTIAEKEFSGFRQSYAGMSYLQALQNRTISGDLPGTDRPETVELLLSSVNEWLESAQ